MVIQCGVTETVDGSRYEFTPETRCSQLDLYVNSVKRTATRLHLSARLTVLCHTAPVTWLPHSTPGQIVSVAHGITTTTPVILWSSVADGLPLGIEADWQYQVVKVSDDVLTLQTITGEPVYGIGVTTGTLYYAQPDPPTSGATLTVYGIQSTAALPTSYSGLWTLADFQARYAVDMNDAACAEALQTAEYRVEQYVTETAWTYAETGIIPYCTEIRRVVAEIATVLLSRTPTQGGVLTEQEKEYDDSIVRHREKYAMPSQSMLTATIDDLLRQLVTWKRAAEVVTEEDALEARYATGALEWYGTGRYVY